MTAARWCRFLLGGVILGGVHGFKGPVDGFFWWSGASSYTSMVADLGGVAQWRLGVRCAEMASRRRRLLSSVMVTSMAEWPDKVEASI